MRLDKIKRFRVPHTIVAETEHHLRVAGSDGHELFVLWSGSPAGEVFDVQTRHIPKQTAYQLPTGLCVRIEGDELHRLNVWLYESGEVLAAQVHAHPADAYHSGTDDTYPVVATPGALSVVAPDFCRRGLLTDDAALYRLDGAGWTRQPQDIVEVV